MTRLTIPRPVFSRLTTQLRRPGNEEVKKLLEGTKQTKAPQGATILWDPALGTCAAVASLLEREMTFVRKKGSNSAQLIEGSIRQLRAYPNHLRVIEPTA